MRPEERVKDVSQSEGEGQSVRSGIPKQSVQSRETVSPKWRVRHFKSYEWDFSFQKLRWSWKVGTMSRWVSISVCCVEFSQSSCDSHEHKYIQECLWVPTSFPAIAVLNLCLSVSFFYPLLFPKDFCTTCKMPTRQGVRRNNGVHTTRHMAKQKKRCLWMISYQLFHPLEIKYTSPGLSFIPRNIYLLEAHSFTH